MAHCTIDGYNSDMGASGVGAWRETGTRNKLGEASSRPEVDRARDASEMWLTGGRATPKPTTTAAKKKHGDGHPCWDVGVELDEANTIRAQMPIWMCLRWPAAVVWRAPFRALSVCCRASGLAAHGQLQP
jgi:hypothetical protein